MTTKPSIEPRWMRVEEAAVYANIGISWVRKLIKEGRLPAMRGGRYGRHVIDRHDLDACLEALKSPKPKK